MTDPTPANATPANVTSARDVILSRIRQANAAAASANQPTGSLGAPAPDLPTLPDPATVTGELLELFVERTVDYRAVVEKAPSDQVAARVAAAVDGANGVLVPDGFPTEWASGIPAGTVQADPGSADKLDHIEGVVTTSTASIAETGTIVLDHAAGQGRRALTLVPDLHVCVVPASTIHRTVPEAMSALRLSVESGRPMTWISGPSATSDIELERVEGVHGPRRLHVIVVTDA